MLTADEQQVWRAFREAVGMLNAHTETQLQREAGMPLAYYEVLVALSETPDQVMRMSDLAVATRSSRSRLSHAVAKMEAEGWVRREACPTDRRGAFAHLTAAGFAAIKAAAPGHVEAVRAAVFDQLTPEQVRQLGEISAAIQQGLMPRCTEVEKQLAEEADRADEVVDAATQASA
ncbi:MarR family transcriptional regulator [Saccharomonospora sp. CUA-673]|uniref:MarR family winged helix-turn-helix transcriptional regulator n=1 Tax=Saccharomonospora sp. CUA-673 TaxID=1904969 RepID=UPI000960C2BF|nr:MarR family transcriptional regulator [Saccharomonospora sp. CUA-673]OLT40345.1 MarR family transcriptional regulator [Saccharomonospora sp. CUA-673]